MMRVTVRRLRFSTLAKEMWIASCREYPYSGLAPTRDDAVGHLLATIQRHARHVVARDKVELVERA